MREKIRTVLFICAENRFRSQIAEAYFNAYAPTGWKAVSAGLNPANSVHLNAIQLMLEDGIDVSKSKPKLLTPDMIEVAEIVVVVCGSSENICPIVQAKFLERWEIPDLAKMNIEESRKWRNEIKRRVFDLIERIQKNFEKYDESDVDLV